MNNIKPKPIVENFNIEEEFLYSKTYLFIKGYCVGKQLKYTLKALPLARIIHNGQYRKGYVNVCGKKYQLPYVLHVLKVCSTLISLNLPMEDDELDILFSSALLHDSIEDQNGFFVDDGKEIYEKYGLPKRVYDIVNMLSKEPGATQEELSAYFNLIKTDKCALLIKLADRSHNVEDLYNMKLEKIHKYVKETRDFIYPLCTYAKANYPELSHAVTIIKSKIVSLTELTETLINMYEERLKEKDDKIKELKRELNKL